MTGTFLEAGLGPEDGETDESDDQDHARPHDEIAEWHREIEPPPIPCAIATEGKPRTSPATSEEDDAEASNQGVTSSTNRGTWVSSSSTSKIPGTSTVNATSVGTPAGASKKTS